MTAFRSTMIAFMNSTINKPIHKPKQSQQTPLQKKRDRGGWNNAERLKTIFYYFRKLQPTSFRAYLQRLRAELLTAEEMKHFLHEQTPLAKCLIPIIVCYMDVALVPKTCWMCCVGQLMTCLTGRHGWKGNADYLVCYLCCRLYVRKEKEGPTNSRVRILSESTQLYNTVHQLYNYASAANANHTYPIDHWPLPICKERYRLHFTFGCLS